MHDSSFWYTYSTVGPRGAREGPGGAQHLLAPPQICLCIKLWHAAKSDIHSFELDGGTHKYVKLMNALNSACMTIHFTTLMLYNHDMAQQSTVSNSYDFSW